jgi:hypothetical protein
MNPKTFISVLWVFTGVVCGQGVSLAQSGDVFTIVSPTQGQVYAPGANVPITVRPGSGVALASISVFSSIGLPSATPVGPLSLTAPVDPMGPVAIAVFVAASGGGGAEADVTIDIESPVRLDSMIVTPASVTMAAPGTSHFYASLSDISLGVLGTYADGSLHTITSSTRTTYSSSDPRVATVDATGNVTAVAPGKSVITVINTGAPGQSRVALQTPVNINIFELKGDLDGDNDVDTDDLAVIEAALGSASTGPGDPRDLNGDGRIDSTDLSLLRSLCSRKNCATQ